MLAMADRNGRVWASIPGLAKEAAVSVEACRTAIAEFLAPDPDSRTKVAEGRRIEEIDGGWRLINHAKYRAIRDEEERRIYKTLKQRDYRSVDNVDKSGQCGPQSTGVDPSRHIAEAEAEAKEQKPSRGEPRAKKSWNEMKHSTDPRHRACQEAIFAYYQSKNEGDDPDWEGREGKALGMFLSANPKLTAEGMKRLLDHRAASEVNHSERPALWISKLKSFRMGPLDKFNRPLNGNGKISASAYPPGFFDDEVPHAR